MYFYDNESLRCSSGDALILFGYFHGLYGLTIWSSLIKNCCQNGAIDLSGGLYSSAKHAGCSFVNNGNAECQSAVNAASNIIYSDDIDIYNLYADCDTPQNSSSSSSSSSSNKRFHSRKLMLKQLGLASNDQSPQKLKDTPPCVDEGYVTRWINQPEVKAALHIVPESADWDICSAPVSDGYTTLYTDLSPQILELVDANLRILIYNGDVDMACNFLGDQWFVDSLGLQLVSDYQKWHYNGQVAGFVKVFKGLTFKTVKGSGHLVPQDKPEQALAMFIDFLQQK